MIYLIGGPSRVGKSILAQRFIEHRPIPSFSCDFTYDMEQVRQLPGFRNAGIIEKANAYYPVLKELISSISYRSEHCIIEGEVILPRHIIELSKEYDIRACFIGLSDTSIEDIVEYGGFFNWPQYKIENNLEQEIQGLAERTTARSKIIEDECNKYSQHYFNLSGNYEEAQAAALGYLLG